MGSKTISIRDDVFERLRKRKREGESYADVIDRLIETDAEVMSGFGAWADTDIDESVREVKREMDEDFEEGTDEVSRQ